MKKPTLISLSSYCREPVPWSVHDLIKQAVNKEDIINHRLEERQLPKITNNKKVVIKEGAGLYTFIQGCLP